MFNLNKYLPKLLRSSRTRTPTILQMEAVECGAASLAIILAYYGKYIPLEELRFRCGVTRDGSNAYNVLEAAKAYDLESEGFKIEPEDLDELEPPYIVFWNFNHFLVVEGLGKKWVFVNDPAAGPRKVSYEDFDKSFTGVVLTFQPGPNFQKSGKPTRLWPMLEDRLRSVKPAVFYIGLTGLALTFPGLVVPAFTQVFYDQVVMNNRVEWGPWVANGLLMTALFCGLLTWLQTGALLRLSTKLLTKFESTFLWHILRLPISFYAQRYSGEIAYRATLNATVVQTLAGNFAATAFAVILIIFYVFMMSEYSPFITWVGILAAILNLFLLWIINRSRNDAYARMQQEMGKSVGFSTGTLQHMESIKAAGNEQEAFSTWAGYYTKRLNAEREINMKDTILTTFPSLLQGLAMTALLGIGASQVMNGDITVGMLLALQSLMTSLLLPITQTVNTGSSLQTMKINISRLDDVLQNKIDPVLTSSPTKSEVDKVRLEGYLELKEVTFGYSPLDPPLIEKLSISLKPGQRVALVGPSGCGKSTIAKLVSGLYTPWEGEILYDGKPLKETPRSVFCSSVAAVDQQIFLFAGSIRENLTLWDSTAEDQDVTSACIDACIHREILARPKGYETHLVEGGANMSGGECQRLEIARALVNNPRILVMDEATSALDSKTEAIISQKIRNRGCTCVMIAHRLSTIQECDEIIVLHQGHVMQRGSHEELRSIPGLYRELVEKETALRED